MGQELLPDVFLFYHCKNCQENFISAKKRIKFCESCGRSDCVVMKDEKDVFICEYCKKIEFGKSKMQSHSCKQMRKAENNDRKEVLKDITVEWNGETIPENLYYKVYDSYWQHPKKTIEALKIDLGNKYNDFLTKFLEKLAKEAEEIKEINDKKDIKKAKME